MRLMPAETLQDEANSNETLSPRTFNFLSNQRAIRGVILKRPRTTRVAGVILQLVQGPKCRQGGDVDGFSLIRKILIKAREYLISILVVNALNAQCLCAADIIFSIIDKHS